MCGIVGYIGPRDAAPILLEGLARLEYRGYDSAGIALVTASGELFVEKRAGKLANLRTALLDATPEAAVGLAHTRWATHGRPNDLNAHPHVDCTGDVTVIHNGIIENFRDLRDGLTARGHRFGSETDTEVLAHLVEEAYAGDIADAVRAALRQAHGAYAVAVLHRGEPDRLIGARHDVPLIVGLGEGENLLASDVAAVLSHTRRVIFLDEGDVADLPEHVGARHRPGRCRPGPPGACHRLGHRVRREGRLRALHGEGDARAAGRHPLGHRRAHPRRRDPARRARAGHGRRPRRDPGGAHRLRQRRLCRGHRVPAARGAGRACRPAGTSAPSSATRPPPLDERTLVIAVTQSGETADTIAPARMAREAGCPLIAVTNSVGSAITREADAVLFLQAGPEIAVVATKTFVTQVTTLVLLAAAVAKARGRLDPAIERQLVAGLRALPEQAEQALALAEPAAAMARRYVNSRGFMFVGRGVTYPVALEGALKLKEVSYVHAEGYAAGELKHGPISLLDAEVPLVAIATRSALQDKLLSNVMEGRARDARVIMVASVGDEGIREFADDILWVPETMEALSPILAIIPLQLFAYHMAIARGTDVDQPRNLAKSVTVE